MRVKEEPKGTELRLLRFLVKRDRKTPKPYGATIKEASEYLNRVHSTTYEHIVSLVDRCYIRKDYKKERSIKPMYPIPYELIYDRNMPCQCCGGSGVKRLVAYVGHGKYEDRPPAQCLTCHGTGKRMLW